MDELRIVAPYRAQSGYSRHARALLMTAIAAGYRVEAVESDTWTVLQGGYDERGNWRIERTEMVPLDHKIPERQQQMVWDAMETSVAGDAPTLILQLPYGIEHWVREYPDSPTIAHTMLECDSIPRGIERHLRAADVLAVPCTYLMQRWRELLPGQPVLHLPEPMDMRQFQPGPAMEIRDRPEFLFGAVSSTHERKHWRELLHAFAEEFAGQPKQVGLWYHAAKPGDIEDLAKGCRDAGAWVKVDWAHWSEEQVASFYRAIQCYALPSHEGFGLGFAEAAIYGVPSVALDVGGQTDIVTPETGFLVPATMAPAVGLYPQYFPSSARWASCTVADLRRVLREAYRSWRYREGFDERGRAAQAWVTSRHSPEAIAPYLRSVVGWACVGRMGREQVGRGSRQEACPTAKAGAQRGERS